MPEVYFSTKKCPICKKEFVPAPQHIYNLVIKGKRKCYCSYTCYRVDQKKTERGRRKSYYE